MELALDGTVRLGDAMAVLATIGTIGGLCWKLTHWQAAIEAAVSRHDDALKGVSAHVEECVTDRSAIKTHVAALDERTELMLAGGHKP